MEWVKATGQSGEININLKLEIDGGSPRARARIAAEEEGNVQREGGKRL